MTKPDCAFDLAAGSQLRRVTNVNLLLGHVYDDKDLQERIVRRSKLDWVIVRPVILTNGPKTNAYQSSKKWPATRSRYCAHDCRGACRWGFADFLASSKSQACRIAFFQSKAAPNNISMRRLMPVASENPVHLTRGHRRIRT
jgi:putative NAD(P)-binding protein